MLGLPSGCLPFVLVHLPRRRLGRRNIGTISFWIPVTIRSSSLHRVLSCQTGGGRGRKEGAYKVLHEARRGGVLGLTKWSKREGSSGSGGVFRNPNVVFCEDQFGTTTKLRFNCCVASRDGRSYGHAVIEARARTLLQLRRAPIQRLEKAK
jgi:hypothetical protein